MKRIDLDMNEVKRLHDEGNDTRKIAAAMNVSQTTLIQRMKDAGLDRRSPGRAVNEIELSNHQLEVITGELLGDGSVSRNGKGPNANCKFQWGGKSREHGVILQATLGALAGYFSPFENKSAWSIGNTYWKLVSRTAPAFSRLRELWYPRGVKIVPGSVALTPTVLLHWFIGDGYIRIRHNRHPYVGFSTQGFDLNSLHVLIRKLTGLGFTPTINQGHGLVIRLSSRDTSLFFTLIGDCPVSDYEHKWP